ncbi:MAG: hypothetical protein LQ347_005454 [Umbilicaria vellea]|nr:MAG: hypothetical protein LQ347_005454 [Umbilicaria vellea]
MSQPDLQNSFTHTFHREPYAAIDPTLPALSVTGKTVVITGGNQGIGRAITNAFAAAGASHIAIIARNATSMAETKAFVEKNHPATAVHAYAASITEAEKVASAFADIRSNIGEPDILILCAGVASDSTTLPTQFDDLFKNFEVNFKGNLIVSNNFLPPDRPKMGKVLINISTGAAHVYAPKRSLYGASKVAFVHVLAHMHNEEKGNGVRIMNMHPGTVLTEMARAVGLSETSGYKWDDVDLPGHFAVWLASPEAAFLAGRFVWANWDVEELKARAKEIEESLNLLKIGLIGEPVAAVANPVSLDA